MKIDILSLFPAMFDGFLQESIMKRAMDTGKVVIAVHDFRLFTEDIHHKVDDTPYGGGRGMVLACQPIIDCLESIRNDDSLVIMLTPDGGLFKQEMAYELSKERHLILLCGHYEGFDERIRSFVDREISIGDFILTGGEIPSMAITDAIVRLIPGVIQEESHTNESFHDALLDYPTYTKPRIYREMEVPEVLLSGDHQKIAEYRLQEQIKRTQERRPDLLKRRGE